MKWGCVHSLQITQAKKNKCGERFVRYKPYPIVNNELHGDDKLAFIQGLEYRDISNTSNCIFQEES